jgi:predicted nucleotidyltransferase
MELWIRSQDKKDLVKVNSLWIMDNQIWMEVPFYENHKKLGLTLSGHNHKLAEYETKERALEVLNEIQNILKPKYILDASSIKPDGDFYKENGAIIQKYNANAKIEELSTFVYQMPEK